jgi:hypothetical protein
MQIQEPQITGESNIDFQRHPDISSLQTALDVIDVLNLMPQIVRKVDFRVCSENDPQFRAEASQLEQAAYENSKYGDRAEGENLFEAQYRGTENHGRIAYIGVYTRKHELAAFFSFFQHKGVIFDQTKEALAQRPDLQEKPIIVVSKIARHPNHSRLLYEAGMPHRNILSLAVFSLAARSENGILIETQAQPDTRRMLQEKTIRKYFPRYEIVLSTPTSDEEARSPHIMLLHFPHMGLKDYLYIGKGIIAATVHNITKKWEA